MTVLSGLKRGVAFAVALVCVNTGLVLATNVPVTVVKDTKLELELSWDTDSFTDGVSHTLNAPGSLTYWSIGPNGPVGGSPVVLGNILLNYLGGGLGWAGDLWVQHIYPPHTGDDPTGTAKQFSISFPNGAGLQTFDSGWVTVSHPSIPHTDWYRLTYAYIPAGGHFAADLKGMHLVPEIDLGGLGSVLALVTGGFGLIERRRFKRA